MLSLLLGEIFADGVFRSDCSAATDRPAVCRMCARVQRKNPLANAIESETNIFFRVKKNSVFFFIDRRENTNFIILVFAAQCTLLRSKKQSHVSSRRLYCTMSRRLLETRISTRFSFRSRRKSSSVAMLITQYALIMAENYHIHTYVFLYRFVRNNNNNNNNDNRRFRGE